MTDPAILLLDPTPAVAPEVLRAHPGALACDCYVAGVEQLGEAQPWGWSVAGGQNIDHHAAVPAMARVVSSANLALRWVAARGDRPAGPVLLTHPDCDSILTAGIVAGRLGPVAGCSQPRGGVPSVGSALSAGRVRREVPGVARERHAAPV